MFLWNLLNSVPNENPCWLRSYKDSVQRKNTFAHFRWSNCVFLFSYCLLHMMSSNNYLSAMTLSLSVSIFVTLGSALMGWLVQYSNRVRARVHWISNELSTNTLKFGLFAPQGAATYLNVQSHVIHVSKDTKTCQNVHHFLFPPPTYGVRRKIKRNFMPKFVVNLIASIIVSILHILQMHVHYELHAYPLPSILYTVQHRYLHKFGRVHLT